jgi:hypothetical protein
VQEGEQVRVRPPPQSSVLPAQHAQPSSQNVSQSSSMPLQVSAGRVHCAPAGIPQLVLHVPVPVEPQLVLQGVGCPLQQAYPLSQTVSQSSSAPLQVSGGGAQVPQAHEAVQVAVPLVPQELVHDDDSPMQQV